MNYSKTKKHTHIEDCGIWMMIWFCSFLSMSTLQHIEFAGLYVFCQISGAKIEPLQGASNLEHLVCRIVS